MTNDEIGEALAPLMPIVLNQTGGGYPVVREASLSRDLTATIRIYDHTRCCEITPLVQSLIGERFNEFSSFVVDEEGWPAMRWDSLLDRLGYIRPGTHLLVEDASAGRFHLATIKRA